MESTLSVCLPIALLAIVFASSSILKRRRLLASLPPGVKPIPFLGNLLDIPSKAPWKTYAAWGRQFNSDLVSVWTGGQLTIVVNSATAARELFEKRVNYGDKPLPPMLVLEGWTSWNASRMPYGEEWRARRRLLHRSLNSNVVGDYIPMQEAHAKQLIKKLHESPLRFSRHMKHFVASISMMAAYGYRIASENDWAVSLAQASIDKLANSTFPGAAAVNMFPFLRFLPDWMPGAGFKSYARECVEMTTRLRNEPFEIVQEMMARGEAPQSISRSLLEADTSHYAYKRLVADVACVFFLGGAETTGSALEMMIIALAMHPDAQRRAQVEIDSVTARTRLPCYDDKPLLPYVSAIVAEALRWSNIHPLGIFRSTMQDDIYNGCFIPAGTTVTWNTWAICHDPEVYPDPDIFRPERFLDGEGQLTSNGEQAVFGYGRRECPGLHFARNALWIVAATTLAVFDYAKALDASGNKCDILLECTDTTPSHPKPFICDVRVRDEKAANLLDATQAADAEN